MSHTEIATTARQNGREYYLVLRARVSASQHATRESGSEVDIYDVRAAAVKPPAKIPLSETQIVIGLGEIEQDAAKSICERVANSGLLQAAFQTRTDPGKTNARVVGQEAVTALHTMATSSRTPAKVRRPAGRPAIGPQVKIRVPDGELAELGARAKTHGISRTELIRRVLSSYIYGGIRDAALLDGLESVTDRNGELWTRNGKIWTPAIGFAEINVEPQRGDGLDGQHLIAARGPLTPTTEETPPCDPPETGR
jgi:hypothetical protein